jgi:hypothetical protein
MLFREQNISATIRSRRKRQSLIDPVRDVRVVVFSSGVQLLLLPILPRCLEHLSIRRQSIRGEFFAKGDNLKFGKKRLEAVSKRWTEVIVHQEFQAASLFSKATASFTSAVDTL